MFLAEFSSTNLRFVLWNGLAVAVYFSDDSDLGTFKRRVYSLKGRQRISHFSGLDDVQGSGNYVDR